MFGTAMAKAFSYCKSAGDKATTAEKLTGTVKALHSRMKSAGSKSPLKEEDGMKHEPSSPRPKKKVKTELGRVLSSPSQVLDLYQANVKKEQGPAKKEQVPGDTILWNASSRGGSF